MCTSTKKYRVGDFMMLYRIIQTLLKSGGLTYNGIPYYLLIKIFLALWIFFFLIFKSLLKHTVYIVTCICTKRTKIKISELDV